jgi:hypothetical protein
VAKQTTPARDALTPAEDAIRAGDYLAARGLLRRLIGDASLSESRRRDAARWLTATRIDRATLWVGLGCLGLFALVVLITAIKQP